MTTIHLTGRITEDGELECELPAGTPPGEARITIEIPIEEGWTPEEVDEALRIIPMTGAEIVEAGLLGGWSEEGITDSEEWVEQQRSKSRERLRW
ncbi:MAG TPA: hypothetical protein VMW27_10115 [Thermoanaerobaculia bacterium]|nr:hypothetical protein [Thermoanaerobaculia bacterium]